MLDTETVLMTRSGLLLAAVAILFTGAALKRTLFPAASAAPDLPRHITAACPADSAAAWRFRQCQPDHWRSCMLQR